MARFKMLCTGAKESEAAHQQRYSRRQRDRGGRFVIEAAAGAGQAERIVLQQNALLVESAERAVPDDGFAISNHQFALD
jgi:hypothetical protein